jgi:hypothetical protein
MTFFEADKGKAKGQMKLSKRQINQNVPIVE